ncbi:Dor1-like family-domain-containing protein [Tuber borchii]|uniref:Conserved oligomeric Golgi complex subunit 8 n=1 Tax=Tuber borchii TaxID=42251 RepID=A0A2T6ZLP2_TUBBO|nr:Dor1-like family-domain-containing protein [Tuber borchii]
MMNHSVSSFNPPLLELLLPHIPQSAAPPDPAVSTQYLSRLSALPLTSIAESEPASLSSSLHSLNLSLQSLSSRSHKSIIAASNHLSAVPESIELLHSSLTTLEGSLPAIDSQITSFTTNFGRDGTYLTNRLKTHLLSKNLDRLLDILQLPTLLQSLISTSSYPTALDLLAHVRRLHSLYHDSPTIGSVYAECETLQKSMTTNLINTLRGPLKLPTAMKTIGFLRRCGTKEAAMDERGLRGLFLVCRLAFLSGLLGALDPLKELAEEERGRRQNDKEDNASAANATATAAPSSWGGGTQTERYLKRWIEVFREQSFGIVSMYKSIFPNALPAVNPDPPPPSSPHPHSPIMSSVGIGIRSRSSSTLSNMSSSANDDDPEGGQAPDPLASFVLHLLSLLTETLGRYLETIEERSVRESLLTQVLYAAGSMGRLGGEFGAILGVIECFGMGDEEQEEKDGDRGEEEWVGVVAKHKVLVSRLETLTGRG